MGELLVSDKKNILDLTWYLLKKEKRLRKMKKENRNS